jgi:hypothetical protein
MTNRRRIYVTHPSGVIRRFHSIHSVARMLSGNGTESGGLREQISIKAANGLYGNEADSIVRNNYVAG